MIRLRRWPSTCMKRNRPGPEELDQCGPLRPSPLHRIPKIQVDEAPMVRAWPEGEGIPGRNPSPQPPSSWKVPGGLRLEDGFAVPDDPWRPHSRRTTPRNCGWDRPDRRSSSRVEASPDTTAFRDTCVDQPSLNGQRRMLTFAGSSPPSSNNSSSWVDASSESVGGTGNLTLLELAWVVPGNFNS